MQYLLVPVAVITIMVVTAFFAVLIEYLCESVSK